MNSDPKRRWLFLPLLLLLSAAVWIGWNAKSAPGPAETVPPRPDDTGAPAAGLAAGEGEPGGAANGEDKAVVHAITIETRGPIGDPVPGVQVEAVSVPEGIADHDAVPALAGAVTDAEGVARLGLPEGRYALRAFHSGWFATNIEVDVPAVNPVVMRLSPGVHLRVKVVDVKGNPVEGAVLTDRWLGTHRGAITGPDGIGDLGAVHPENAFIWVSKPGWLTNRAYLNRLGMKGDEHLGTLKIHRGGTLVVTAKEESTGAILEDVSLLVDTKGWDRLTAYIGAGGRVELPGALLPPQITVRGTLPDGRHASVAVDVVPGEGLGEAALLFPPGRMVAGIVVLAGTGKPVPGAALYYNYDGVVRPCTETDAAGRFQFGPVRGDADSDVELHVETPTLVMREVDAGEVVPGPEGPGKLIIELVRTGTLHGLVRGPDGEPASGVQVSIRDSDGACPRVGADLETRTDEQGAWRVEGVPPGRMMTVLAITEDRGIAWGEEVTVEPGGVAGLPDIELPGAFTFSVPVVSASGEPVARGWFWFRYRVKTEGMWAEWRVIRDGRFAEVTGIPRPGAVVELEGPGFLKTVLRVGPDTKTVVMDRPMRASGRAVRAEGGAPFSNVLLYFASRDRLSSLEGNNARAKTDQDGRFEVSGLRPGRYEVRSLVETTKAEVEIRMDGENLGLVRFE